MSVPRDLSKHDERALDLLRRNRAGSEDWLYVAGAILRLVEAQDERIKALEAMVVEDEPEAPVSRRGRRRSAQDSIVS